MRTTSEMEYTARVIMQDIRNNFPNDQIAEQLPRRPLIDYLRCCVKEDDFILLKDVVNKMESDNKVILALSLLLPFVKQPSIKQFISDLWSNKSISIPVRNELIWLMLKHPDIKRDFHEDAYNYLFNNEKHWQSFNMRAEQFYGSGNNMLLAIIDRLGNAQIEESYKWIFYCLLLKLIDENKNAVLFILQAGTHSADEFTSNVCHELLTKHKK